MVDPEPKRAARLFARHRPSLIETFPNVFLRWEELAEHPDHPLANVRVFLSTFDAAHPRTIRRLLSASRRRFPVYAQAYAQSELGAIAIGFRTRGRTASPRGDARDVGRPALALTRVRLVDPATGQRVRRPGVPGSIQVRSPGQFAGYLGEPERTEAQRHAGWWDTGDIGSRTRGRRLRLAGRAVDAVPGVDNPLAVEDLLLNRLPELTELVLIRLPGEQHAVPVVCTHGDVPLDLGRWQAATAGLPVLAQPRQLSWERLPTTATWKVRRPALVQLLASSQEGTGDPPTQDRSTS